MWHYYILEFILSDSFFAFTKKLIIAKLEIVL